MDKALPPEVAATTCTLGLAVLNAVCEELTLRIFTDGDEWHARYERGSPVTKLEFIGPTEARGTELTFTLDATFLPDIELDFDALVAWARTNVRGMALHISDARDGRTVTLSA